MFTTHYLYPPTAVLGSRSSPSFGKAGNETHFVLYLPLSLAHVATGMLRVELAGIGESGGNQGALTTEEVVRLPCRNGIQPQRPHHKYRRPSRCC